MNKTDIQETPKKILEVAFRLLHRDGYNRLNSRDIAAEVGVNHALINYYFGSKDKLVIAALDEANRRLIERQVRMYNAPGSFTEKWAQARSFYEEDLASGFVRVQMELWAASISNLELRKDFLPRIRKWRQVLIDATTEALKYYELDLPFSANAIGTWVFNYWVGLEFSMLLEIPENEGHHKESLDAIEFLLEQLDYKSVEGSRLKVKG